MTSERTQRRRLLRTSLAVVLAATTATGCAPIGGGADKAGGAPDPVVLRLANTSYGSSTGLERHPAVQYFVDQVKELSAGALRIDVVSGWGDRHPDAEQQVFADVAGGKVDLGWVGTSVFDTLGDTDFQALTAPMLIDSYPLQQAVLDSDIPARMLTGLDQLGVRGLALLDDGLRKPIATTRPLLRPDDYEGITFSAFRSLEHASAIRALGATPTDIGVDVRTLRDGAIDGYEKGLRIYELNGFSYLTPYVTANVNLWPHTLALIANPDRLAGLTTTQRDWLTTAATDAASRSTDLTDDDPEMLLRLCQEGARFAVSAPADLDAMRQAFATEYAIMDRDPTTKAFIDQIEALKQTTDPGPGLDVPADCTGPAAVTPARGSIPATTTVVGVATALDGTYRWTLSAADAMAHGMPGDKTPESQATFPWVFTMSMDNGRWSLVHRQADGDVDDGAGSYTVDGDQVSFDWNADVLTFTFSVDGDGAVHLDPDPAINPGDAFVWATNPWTKIADGTATATVLDGTYRWTLTKDDAVAHGNPTPQELPTFPWVFTMTMDAGTWQLANIDGQGVANSDAGHGSYAVEGDRVVFHEAAEVFSYTFSADPDGTVHLVAQPPINPGTAWVFATNPWTKIN